MAKKTLASLRHEAGLSQKQLGDFLFAADRGKKPGTKDFTQPRIAAYETGRNQMTLRVAALLVKILNKQLAKAGSPTRVTINDLAG